jgi:tRNA1(Val) A37 N6-methylase TrmN6
MPADLAELSDDAALGGRLRLRQPLHGHRFGHDAILLAAAVPAAAGERAIEFGAGVGAAGLALARRVENLAVTLVEFDSELCALAADNAGRNGLADRVRAVCLDVTAPAAAFVAAGLAAGAADHVLMNPPFNAPHNPSPDRGRRVAHTGSPEMLEQWLLAAARLLRPSGMLTLIWRADGLADVLPVIATGHGAISVLPIHPKPDTGAIRVIVRAVKSGSGPPMLNPGFVLAEMNGKPTAQAEAVLREGVALDFPESSD